MYSDLPLGKSWISGCWSHPSRSVFEIGTLEVRDRLHAIQAWLLGLFPATTSASNRAVSNMTFFVGAPAASQRFKSGDPRPWNDASARNPKKAPVVSIPDLKTNNTDRHPEIREPSSRSPELVNSRGLLTLPSTSSTQYMKKATLARPLHPYPQKSGRLYVCVNIPCIYASRCICIGLQICIGASMSGHMYVYIRL